MCKDVAVAHHTVIHVFQEYSCLHRNIILRSESFTDTVPARFSGDFSENTDTTKSSGYCNCYSSQDDADEGASDLKTNQEDTDNSDTDASNGDEHSEDDQISTNDHNQPSTSEQSLSSKQLIELLEKFSDDIG
jgi:hypothetical protein